MSLPIGEVARLSGLSHDTLRFYEREGLVDLPERTPGGDRRYEPKVLDQLEVIRTLREVDFSLDQVRSVLAVKSTTHTVRGRIEGMRTAISELEAALEDREAAITRARDQLTRWREQLDLGEPWPDTPLEC